MLELTGAQILAHRRRVQALETRLPPGADSLRRAASVGLQDSVPRSALHALHARVADVGADALDDPSLAQVWGPRFTVYVVPAGEHLPFTLGRLPEAGRIRRRAEELADRLHRYLDGRSVPYAEASRALGVDPPNMLRYAALTGGVLIRWEGARQPTIRSLPRSDVDPVTARVDLVRRYLHAFGPASVEAFSRWGGVDVDAAATAFYALRASLVAVRTPLGDAWMLADDEEAIREPVQATDAVRLLPSGDPYFLLWGADRDLLLPDAARRAELWTSRVWPGAMLIAGAIAGTWRRAAREVVAKPWRVLAGWERRAVEEEAAALPLAAVNRPISVRWTA